MSEHISTREFRRRLGVILSRVHRRRDRFVIERKGKALAAVVPVETLEAMERLSHQFLQDVLTRRRGADVSEERADALANEAKHGSRGRRRR